MNHIWWNDILQKIWYVWNLFYIVFIFQVNAISYEYFDEQEAKFVLNIPTHMGDDVENFLHIFKQTITKTFYCSFIDRTKNLWFVFDHIHN